jgi:hypothetical protein
MLAGFEVRGSRFEAEGPLRRGGVSRSMPDCIMTWRRGIVGWWDGGMVGGGASRALVAR